MAVKISIPNNTGHTVQEYDVPEARKVASDFLQKKWLMSINGNISRNTSEISESDEVTFYPPISGG